MCIVHTTIITCCVAYYYQCWRKRLLCRPLRNMFMQAFDDLLKPDLIQLKSTKKGISIYIIMHLCNVTMYVTICLYNNIHNYY